MHPIEIHQPTPDLLAITWQGGSTSSISTRELRRHCPCSVCQTRERSASATYLPVMAPGAFAIREINLVGSSGLQIIWDDGHSNAVYSYSLIRRIAPPTEPG